MEKRKTGKEYQVELYTTRIKLKSIENHIGDRLLELIAAFPDAIIHKTPIDEWKTKSITKIWMERLSVDEKIGYIKKIEEWNKSQELYKQGKLDL